MKRVSFGEPNRGQPLKKIKEYLTTPPVLRASKSGKDFKMYIVAQERMIGAVLL
jgi:hypothetical protein